MQQELINQIAFLIVQQEQNLHMAGVTDIQERKIHWQNLAKEIINLVASSNVQTQRLSNQDFDDMQHNMQGMMNVMGHVLGDFKGFDNNMRDITPKKS